MHQSHGNIRQPTAQEVNELPGPIGDGLMPPSQLPIMLGRGEQDTQKRQRPGAFGPAGLTTSIKQSQRKPRLILGTRSVERTRS